MCANYIAIDWSGARTNYKNIAVAGADKTGLVQLLQPPQKSWRRMDVAALIAQADPGILIGLDFSFALPQHNKGYMAAPESTTPQALWQFVDAQAAGAPDFYAGASLKPGQPMQPYFLSPHGGRGAKFASHYRVCEQAARARGMMASSTFHGIGPSGVALGALAGMRLLHALRTLPNLTIWPFAPRQAGNTTLCEIFPTAYYKAVGSSSNPWQNQAMFAETLAYYAAKTKNIPQSEDEADALLSAAALRYYDQQGWFEQDQPAAAHMEGWIVGI